MDKLGQVDIEMTAQLLQKKNIILNVHGTFFKKHYILTWHKSNFNKFQKIKIIQNMFQNMNTGHKMIKKRKELIIKS